VQEPVPEVGRASAVQQAQQVPVVRVPAAVRANT
jgi:hypothetical protein